MKEKYHKKAGHFFGRGVLQKLLEKRAAAKLAGGVGAPPPLQPIADVSAPPPLPPPEFQPEEAIEYAGGLKLGDRVRIWSDRHGRQWCSQTGVVKSIASNLSLVIETDTLQQQTVMIEEVELVSGLKAVAPAKSLRQITGAMR